jgi:hypothetical protein
MASLRKKIKALVADRPEYEINPEYQTNQALALNQAFGRDTAIQGQEENIEQQAADDVGMAQQYSGNTAALLNTIGSINTGKNAALRNLGNDEAAIQRQKMQSLYGANTAMAEEKDKAWNYNVNEPYMTKLADLRAKKKARQENLWKGIDTIASLGTNLLAPGAGSLLKGKVAGIGGTPTMDIYGGNGSGIV